MIINITFSDWEAEQMKDPEFARECLLASKHYQAERRRIKKRIKARENITKGRREKSRIILSLGDGYNVLKPIRIRLKRYADNDFVADWIAVRAYGYGESPEEAIENLRLAIMDDYDALSGCTQSELGSMLLKSREIIMAHISREAIP